MPGVRDPFPCAQPAAGSRPWGSCCCATPTARPAHGTRPSWRCRGCGTGGCTPWAPRPATARPCVCATPSTAPSSSASSSRSWQPSPRPTPSPRPSSPSPPRSDPRAPFLTPDSDLFNLLGRGGAEAGLHFGHEWPPLPRAPGSRAGPWGPRGSQGGGRGAGWLCPPRPPGGSWCPPSRSLCNPRGVGLGGLCMGRGCVSVLCKTLGNKGSD